MSGVLPERPENLQKRGVVHPVAGVLLTLESCGENPGIQNPWVLIEREGDHIANEGPNGLSLETYSRRL